VRSKTEGKTLQLRKGDELKLGNLVGKVLDVSPDFLELETEGKRWTVGLDESIADAFKKSMED
jgi:preprotein translocase subunit YajC